MHARVREGLIVWRALARYGAVALRSDSKAVSEAVTGVTRKWPVDKGKYGFDARVVQVAVNPR